MAAEKARPTDAAPAVPAAALPSAAGAYFSAAGGATRQRGGAMPASENAVPLGAQFPQVLGRHTWFVIHAAARNVRDAPSLDGFKRLMLALLDNYPCMRCRNNSRTNCATWYQQLGALTHRADRVEPNFEAVVWAKRLHACVTLSVHRAQRAGDTTSWVSAESVALARRVRAAGRDERAVYEAEA